MNSDTTRMEKILKLILEMDEIGSSNDELSRLVQKERFMNNRELSADDLDLIAAAQSNPNYKKFMGFVLNKNEK